MELLTPEPVRAVVFDIGGVLLHWDPGLVYRDLIPDEAERERFLAEICTPAWNATLDAGRHLAQACAELAERHPGQADRIWAWSRQDEMIGGEIPGTADLVARLVEADVATYLLTNMPAEVFAARRARYPVLQRFRGAVVSGEVGLLKPHPEIFEHLIASFGLDRAGSLFVDDLAANVAGARAVGLGAHHFVDADHLERDLVERGFLS